MKKLFFVLAVIAASVPCLSLGAVDAFWFKIADGDSYGLPFESLDSIRNDGAAVTVVTKTNYRTTLGRAQLLAVTPGEDTRRVDVMFDGSRSTVSNAYAFNGVSVTRRGADVVVNSTIDEVVTYRLSGSASCGSFKIYSLKEFVILLDGVAISNDYGAAIDIQSSKAATIKLAGASVLANASQGVVSDDENASCALFSTGDIVISGDGSLDVAAASRHAIVAGGNIEVSGGSVKVACSGNAAVEGGVTSYCTAVCPGRDFVMSGGLLEITHSGEAGKGVEAGGDVKIADGSFVMTSMADGSVGLESGGSLTVSGGEIVIEAVDACVNAGSQMQISGGMLKCIASAGDAIASNGTVSIAGGTVVACGAGCGIDCADRKFSVTGGLVIGIGGSNSSPTPAACSQPVVLCRVSNMTAESKLTVTDAAGTPLFTFLCPAAYGREAWMVMSTPGFAVGGTYRSYKGGNVSGGETLAGVVTVGSESYIPGAQQNSFTFSSFVQEVR